MPALTVEEAIERLIVIPDYDYGGVGPTDCVHTFRELIGANWRLEEARAAFEQYGGADELEHVAFPSHGICIVDDTGPVYFETGSACKADPEDSACICDETYDPDDHEPNCPMRRAETQRLFREGDGDA